MSQRGTVTKLVKEINESLGKDAPDKDLLQVKFNRLPAKHGELKELGEKNKAQLLDDKAEEHETMEDYEEKDEMIRVKLKKILHPVSERLPSPEPTTSTIRSESICRQHIMNVLKMEINKFNGDIENCLGFWTQFKRIHEEESVDPAHKFQILVQSMEKDSRAKKVVNSYP